MLSLDQVSDAVASETADRDLILTDCDCEKSVAYAGGQLPEYFSTARECARAWVDRILHQDKDDIASLYWGIHFKRQHVLHVRNRYGLASLAVLPFGYPAGYPVGVKE